RRPAEVARRVHAAEHLRAPPLRPLLQRQQVRRRGGHLRGAGPRPQALPHRREPHRGPRLLHGRGGVLAVCRAPRRAGGRRRPGGGCAETAEFLRVFQDESVKPTPYEQKLWHWYDCTDDAVNLANCPVVAYSGEIDKQKQAADVMDKALRAEGITLIHVIGPK